MKKYKVAIYKVPDNYTIAPYEIVWDYEWIDNIVEGENADEVEEYVCDYLEEQGEKSENFIIKIEEVI